MDTEDESTAYLKLFNEGPHNYLLHSGEDGLNDAFPVESIFTEIASDWTTEGFPILLSGPLITENNDSESASTNVQLLTKESENSMQNEDTNEDNTITFYSNGQQNKFIFPNDVLLRVQEADSDSQENTVTHVINGNTYSITYAQENQNDVAQESNENVEVIQLLNIDGTVTTINKNLLQTVNGKEKTNNCDNFYTQVEANKCKICSFLCESVEDIRAHIKIKHAEEIQQGNGITLVKNGHLAGTKMTSILNVNREKKKYTLFVCSSCGNGYSQREDLRQHMIAQHKMVQTPASSTVEQPPPDKPPPPEKTSPRDVATNLIKKQKLMRKFKCSIKGCPLRFDKEESCRKHEDCHVDQNKKQFMCTVCKMKFSIWRICCMHMWKSHSIDLGLLTCPMCNQFKSYSSGRVITHMAIHNEEKPFVCTSCGKHFKQLNQLYFHEISHKSPEELPSSFTKKRCEVCDRLFANSKCLKKHIKFVHDKFKPFICNICGHQTARKEMLQLHHRQHTGDKPFSCSYCDYKTADRNCLRRHTMRHFGVAKYLCPYCNYQSIQSSAYKVHLTTKHPGKEGTYACSICKYITINLNGYLSHVKCHEQEQKKKKTSLEVKKRTVEDSESKSSDETQNFLNNEHSEEAVDTGGITIPASFDLQLSNDQTII